MESISISKLTRHYDGHACHVLYANRIIGENIAERGKPRRFIILQELPTPEAYLALRREYYTRTFGELLDEAYGEIEGVRDELDDWYNNMPENLQGSEKGNELSLAIDATHDCEPPDCPESLQNMRVVYVPQLHGKTSRTSRLSDAVDMLTVLSDAISPENSSDDDVQELKENLAECIGTLEGLDVPGMY